MPREKIRLSNLRAGLEVRHDLHGFYVCSTAEGEHEDAGHPSVGFDGRPHFSTVAEAWADSDAYQRGAVD